MSRPAAGFSHGSAGIAWALFELAAATGDARYADAAVATVDFERNFLATEFGAKYGARLGWCHGAASVAVGRALSLPVHDDDHFREEVAVGARALGQGLGHPASDHGLCHGVGGYADMLGRFADVLGVAEWHEQASRYMRRVQSDLSALEGDGMLPIHGRFAGFMTGLAGVGWALLRQQNPCAVPSILMLDAPPDG